MPFYLSDFFDRNNISLHTIPLTWCLALLPRMWGRIKYAQAVGHDMDIRNPRDHYNAVASEKALNPELKGRILRAEGAMQNHLDNMGLFAAAVVAGNLAKLSPAALNGLSLGYFFCRGVYMYVYIRNETRAQAFVRAATFFSGLGMVFALFHMAGSRGLRLSLDIFLAQTGPAVDHAEHDFLIAECSLLATMVSCALHYPKVIQKILNSYGRLFQMFDCIVGEESERVVR